MGDSDSRVQKLIRKFESPPHRLTEMDRLEIEQIHERMEKRRLEREAIVLKHLVELSSDEINDFRREIIATQSNDKPRPPTPPTILLRAKPWRFLDNYGEILEGNIKEDIKKLNPKKSPGVLMLGPVASGKSSFINSCFSVIVGRKRIVAQTGSDDGSFTLKFDRYNGPGGLEKIRFLDAMGIEGAIEKGITKEDVILLLQGHIKKKYKFSQDKPIDKKSSFYKRKPKFEDKTHCVVFVIDATTIYAEIPKAYANKIKDLQTAIKNTRIQRVLILTKCELLCSEVEEDANNIFRSVKVENAVKTASGVFGIDISSIHPVINYEADFELSTAKNIPILLALRQILHYACDSVEDTLKD